jgi:uncharacterized protein with FMN-binding domain
MVTPVNRLTRNLTWLLSTLTVLVLLFGYKTSTGGSNVAADSAVVSGAGTAPARSSGGGSASSGSSGTVTGDVAQTRWGPVQVALSVAGGKVTDVQVVEYPHENPRDAEINSYALPILVQETVDAQSADIDMVSGATVTSQGYLSSLQSALDRAGL